MTKSLQLAALGGLAAIGLASAATAQQAATGDQASQPARSVQKGMMDRNQMMMNDPQMRKQMTGMMEHCGKMMKKMEGMQMGAKPRS